MRLGLNQDSFWPVITAFFEEKKLVRQQLDSFDRFISNTMQSIVEDESRLEMVSETQFTGAEDDITVCCALSWAQHSVVLLTRTVRSVATFSSLISCA